jgi:hypothetical protein
MNYTNEQILSMVEEARKRFASTDSRLLVLANDAVFSDNSREVFKKVKSKKVNNSSRLSEELNGLTSSPLEEEHLKDQKAVDNYITPAITSSREITGITAQHSRTKAGIKVSLSIQTQTDVATGAGFASLTAELKRHGRLRELKRYSGDSAAFEQHYIDTIDQLKDLTPEQGRRVCCGRIHERGKRAAWFADMMVVGNLDETGTYLESIIVWYGNEEYEIAMNEELSERQKTSYYSHGIYGEIKSNIQTPTLATARRRQF